MATQTQPAIKQEKRVCQKCKGRGYFSANLMNHGTKSMDFHHAIPCDFPGCHNGIVDIEENQRQY